MSEASAPQRQPPSGRRDPAPSRRAAGDLVEVRISVPDAVVGQDIADLLVTERLAACVQMLGEMTSTFVWSGVVERQSEWLLLAKTTAARLDALIARVEQVHPYDTPEIMAVPVSEVSAAYAAWVAETV